MDESQFLKNERPNEYEVLVEVSGEVRLTLTADSVEDARRQAEAMIAAEDIGLEPEEVEEARVSRSWKSAPMFLVLRDGQTMQVSRLNEGDLPRQRNAHGF